MNRYVEPKVIANPDGSITMALSEDADVTRRKDSLDGSDDVSQEAVMTRLRDNDDDVTQQEDEQNTISLSVDDLIQYAQPMPVHLIQVRNLKIPIFWKIHCKL
jgi:hypothetical protein